MLLLICSSLPSCSTSEESGTFDLDSQQNGHPPVVVKGEVSAILVDVLVLLAHPDGSSTHGACRIFLVLGPHPNTLSAVHVAAALEPDWAPPRIQCLEADGALL